MIRRQPLSLRFAMGAAIGLAVLAGATSGMSATPHVLVRSEPISAFAQDGSTIAWAGRPEAGCVGVSAAAVGSRSRRSWCYLPDDYVPASDGLPVLAVSNRTILWRTGSGGIGVEGFIETASLSRPKRRKLGFYGYSGGGSYVTGMAGDRGTLLFSSVQILQICDGGPCSYDTTGGHLFRVVAGRATRVDGVPPLALLAVSKPYVAFAPAVASYEGTEFPRPALNGTVEVRELSTWKLAFRAQPAGVVRALALSGNRLAALVEGEGGMRIDCFGVPGGPALTSITVDNATAPSIDIALNYVVTHAGRDIHLAHCVGGTDRLLWRARREPVGLSIEGRRIAWAESRRHSGRVVAITLFEDS